MGVRANETGVTLTFFKPDGSEDPTNPPVTGEFAYFFSIHRPVDPTGTDPALGSKDWLTDIIVVDNPIKLTTITPTQSGIQLTSAASQHVLVRWDVAGQRGTLTDCFTISKGHSKPGRLFAETVAVLDPHTIMDQSHPLWPDWTVAGQQLLTQAQKPIPGTASSNKP